MEQHLQAYESQDGNQAVFKVAELLEHVGQKEVHGAKPKNGKNVRTEDQERVGGDGQYCRDAVYGKQYISEVMANIAGTLSTANNTSMTSMTTSATNNGVA